VSDDNKVTINGKEYDLVELEDNEQYYVNQVRNLKARIAEARFNIDQLVAAEDAFTKALITSVEAEKTETETGE